MYYQMNEMKTQIARLRKFLAEAGRIAQEEGRAEIAAQYDRCTKELDDLRVAIESVEQLEVAADAGGVAE